MPQSPQILFPSRRFQRRNDCKAGSLSGAGFNLNVAPQIFESFINTEKTEHILFTDVGVYVSCIESDPVIMHLYQYILVIPLKRYVDVFRVSMSDNIHEQFPHSLIEKAICFITQWFGFSIILKMERQGMMW